MSNTDTQTHVASPHLVAPREADVVYGEEITFQWQPVDGAEKYALEVATDAKFKNVVLEEDLGEQTAVTVGGYFPTDGTTFFWRVVTFDGDSWSRGERIESFIAASEEDARRALGSPNEEMGPVTELVRAATADVSAKMLEPEGRFEKEKEMGVAYEGIAAGQIMSIALSILLVIGIAVVTLFNWYNTTSAEQRDAVVNSDQYTELRETEAAARNQLESSGVVNEQEGVYRIPIDEAMEIIATESYTERERIRQAQSPAEEGGAQE